MSQENNIPIFDTYDPLQNCVILYTDVYEHIAEHVEFIGHTDIIRLSIEQPEAILQSKRFAMSWAYYLRKPEEMAGDYWVKTIVDHSVSISIVRTAFTVPEITETKYIWFPGNRK